ncbi:MAG: PAS domain-containing protein [Pseudomonadota bacterium]
MTKDACDDAICVDFAKARLRHSTDMLHSQTRALFAYWDRLRAGRPVPFRSEIDPRDMDCDARHLFILESLGSGNIRFRLAGSSISDAFGMELRGMSVRAIMEGRSRESIAALVEEVLEEPGVGYARLIEDTEAATTWEMILLPLKSDLGSTDRVIGALHPVSGPGSHAGVDVSTLKFLIDEMNIRPVDYPMPDLKTGRAPTHEFAEEQAPFTGQAPTGHLTSIEGGLARAEQESDETPRTRPQLRLVKDE